MKQIFHNHSFIRKGGGKGENFVSQVERGSIQMTIAVSFSVVAVLLTLCISLVLYARFQRDARQKTLQNTEQVMEQTRAVLENDLVGMRQISDAVNFNVIAQMDASEPAMQQEMGLIYESHSDVLNSIALYNGSGSLVAAVPVASQKTDPNVTGQEWFQAAMEQIENMHFSIPHVQNLFDDSGYRYHWVISLSRAVDVTDSDVPELGVLLVDMNDSIISEIMEQINQNDSRQYYYLCDSSGRIIYHPRKILISDGTLDENSVFAAAQEDGVTEDTLDGRKRNLVIRTISYTGWKLVGVIPENAYSYGIVNFRYYIVVVMLLTVMMLLAVNRVVARRISRPILALNDSVKEYEAGEKPEIAIGGSSEIRHLGRSIQNSYEQIDELMEQIVREQNERRKSELDALQSQINPHFLYNTLDSITWMVEGGKNNEAVYMISELARLLRISLSKGHSVIRVGDELQHAKSYMNIQKIRYRDRFSVSYKIQPEVEDCCCVKLILQPILENAIYYGVGDMDEDEGGEIRVSGFLEKQSDSSNLANGDGGEAPAEVTDGDGGEERAKVAGDDGGDSGTKVAAGDGGDSQVGGAVVVLKVSDNGLGMTSEEAVHVLTNTGAVHKHGSGVGLVNVNRRIHLTFGEGYGLSVESEPDVGTTVTARFLAVPFTEENQKRLEEGRGRTEDSDET